MKGYKGFEPGLICRGKQYAENTVFEESEARICSKGMHFCQDPYEVLKYYPVIGDDGKINDFAEVEALDEVKTDDNKKFCTKKLKVGARLGLGGFINACVNFLFEKAEFDKMKDEAEAASGYASNLAASGYASNLAASGIYSKLAASGRYSKLAASGDESKLAASGDESKLAASGYASNLAASGRYSNLAASGYASNLAASGRYSNLAASGRYSKLAASGYASNLAASGDESKLAASGDESKLAASGYASTVECSGEDSVIVCAGHGCRAKAKIGCWITLAEWKYDGKKGHSVPVCVKTEFVDGERIKEDMFYELKNGEFVEA